jgi:hypothetical protein
LPVTTPPKRHYRGAVAFRLAQAAPEERQTASAALKRVKVNDFYINILDNFRAAGGADPASDEKPCDA